MQTALEKNSLQNVNGITCRIKSKKIFKALKSTLHFKLCEAEAQSNGLSYESNISWQ